jgi:hypothetical protein
MCGTSGNNLVKEFITYKFKTAVQSVLEQADALLKFPNAKHNSIFTKLYILKGTGYLLLIMSIILPGAPAFTMQRVRHMILVFL